MQQRLNMKMDRFYNFNWEVIEQETPWDLRTKIYIFDKSSKPQLAKIVNGNIELEDIKEGVQMPPTLEIPTDVWNAIKKCMTFKDKTSVVETSTELKATKYHLEDMRKLVFKELNETT